MNNIEEVFDLAKLDMFAKRQNAFICSVFCSLKHVFDPSVETACTDGIVLKINPQWFTERVRPMRVTVLVHETWHVVLKHPLRRGDRDPKIWNYACDYWINNMMDDAGYVFEMGLINHDYDGMSVPEIYDILMQQASQLPPNPMDGDIAPAPSTEEEKQKVETLIDSMLIKASMAAKMSGQAGSIPGEVDLYLEELLNPKLPWNVILRDYVNEITKNDYSWSKFNRRYLPDFYLPSLNDNGLDHILFYTDLSGSVTDEQVRVYISEIYAIWEQLKPKRITLCTFDTAIRNEYEIEDGFDLSTLKFTGRGGTSLYPVMAHAKEHKPNLIVVFSDLDCTPMTEVPNHEVIWVCLDNPQGKVNFGKLIHVKS